MLGAKDIQIHLIYMGCYTDIDEIGVSQHLYSPYVACLTYH